MLEPHNVVALNTRGLINLMAGQLNIARWVFEEKVLREDRTRLRLGLILESPM